MDYTFLNQSPSKTIISSVPEGADALIISNLFHAAQSKRPILYIARDDARMEHMAELLEIFLPELDVLLFPAWDCQPYDRISPNNTIVSQRLTTLATLASDNVSPRVIITTVNAIIQRVLPRQTMKEHAFHATQGQEIKRDSLSQLLVDNGYMNVGVAHDPGEFSLRGSIVDIITTDANTGYRLDFFGNQLESIRYFDPLTQISSDQCDAITIIPASEVLLNNINIDRFRHQYRTMFGAVTQDDPFYESICAGRKYSGMEHWLPLYYEGLESFFDYIDPNIIFVSDHLMDEACEERHALIQDHYETRCLTAKEMKASDSIYHPLPPAQLYLTKELFNQSLESFNHIALYPFALPDKDTTTIDTGFKPGPDFASQSKKESISVFELLKNYKHTHTSTPQHNNSPKRLIITCFSAGSQQRMINLLNDHNIHPIALDGWQDIHQVKGKSIGVIVLPLERGFIAHNILLVSEQDILGERIRRKPTRKRSENFLKEASSLSTGELVVHKEHGIGQFIGLHTLTIGGNDHDCLLLHYHNDDKLYLPVENIDVLSRYGEASEAVKLDKLGSPGWQARKAKLKGRIKIAAETLLAVAAKRHVQNAPTLEPPRDLYDEFCARFPYVETDDQLRSIEEVENDLAAGTPMDRLICGDVGFGKTEIALRAAFIVISSTPPLQVAVVVPTTLLSRQHYQSFKERFAGMPVNIRQLSRMVSAKEAKETREAIKEGSVDIVIGTHALLAKSVSFKRLGLLILDEEQNFGVGQKERLKQLKHNIHVLTLTATPIPRTLQMSLTGIKDLSLIATPPIDRLAVRTFVMPFDDMIIREAILREQFRGGRTFYVCPRIKDLDEVAKKINKLVPEVKIVKAHGQMSSTELDNIMNDFYNGTYDVLLSTTIIESGIDIPFANTIIIHRADMFALSALYQLRGRVGRSKTRAYAYLTLPPKRTPTKNALKRLEVMQTLDTLGAGFSLASHDMDIRGCGNLLGEAQSGQVKEVGVELYQEMLRETISNLKQSADAQIEEESWSPQITLGLPVLIPENYVNDLSLRLGLYRRVGQLETEAEVESFAAELIDRFGPIPQETEYLLTIIKLKQLCRQAGIEKIDAGPKGIVITFRHNQFAQPEALLNYIQRDPIKRKLRGDQKLVITQSWDSAKERLNGISQSLNTIIKLAA